MKFESADERLYWETRVDHVAKIAMEEIQRYGDLIQFKRAIADNPSFVRESAARIAMALVSADMSVDIRPLVKAAVIGLAVGC